MQRNKSWDTRSQRRRLENAAYFQAPPVGLENEKLALVSGKWSGGAMEKN